MLRARPGSARWISSASHTRDRAALDRAPTQHMPGSRRKSAAPHEPNTASRCGTQASSRRRQLFLQNKRFLQNTCYSYKTSKPRLPALPARRFSVPPPALHAGPQGLIEGRGAHEPPDKHSSQSTPRKRSPLLLLQLLLLLLAPCACRDLMHRLISVCCLCRPSPLLPYPDLHKTRARTCACLRAPLETYLSTDISSLLHPNLG